MSVLECPFNKSFFVNICCQCLFAKFFFTIVCLSKSVLPMSICQYPFTKVCSVNVRLSVSVYRCRFCQCLFAKSFFTNLCLPVSVYQSVFYQSPISSLCFPMSLSVCPFSRLNLLKSVCQCPSVSVRVPKSLFAKICFASVCLPRSVLPVTV